MLTNEERRSHIIEYDTCEICVEQGESILHVLRDCPNSKKIWIKMGVQNFQPNFFNTNTQDWWRINLYRNQKDIWDSSWSQTFTITCWLLWKWRKCHIFKESSQIPFDKCNTIRSYLEECKVCWSPSLLYNTPRTSEIHASWMKPPRGWLKINVYGA